MNEGAKLCAGKKVTHVETPSTGAQNTANKEELGAALEARGAQVTDTKATGLQAFQVLGLG